MACRRFFQDPTREFRFPKLIPTLGISKDVCRLRLAQKAFGSVLNRALKDPNNFRSKSLKNIQGILFTIFVSNPYQVCKQPDGLLEGVMVI